jgi:hypothetical protein
MPFVPGREPADHRRGFDSLARLEKAVAALDITKIGSANLNAIQKVLGAARAELSGSRTASTSSHGLGITELAKNAERDITAQRAMREAVQRSSETEQVKLASARMSAAKMRPTAAVPGQIVTDHGRLGKSLQPYGVSGVTSPSRLGDYQSAPNLPTVARDTNNLYRQLAGAGGGLDPDFARTLAATLDAPELDPATFQPIQRSAASSATPTGPVVRDIREYFPTGANESVGAGEVKTAVSEIMKDFSAEIQKIATDSAAKATGVSIEKLVHDELIRKLRNVNSEDEADELLTHYGVAAGEKLARVRREFDTEITRIRKRRS